MTSTPSSRRSYMHNVASMAWHFHAIEQTQSQWRAAVKFDVHAGGSDRLLAPMSQTFSLKPSCMRDLMLKPWVGMI